MSYPPPPPHDAPPPSPSLASLDRPGSAGRPPFRRGLARAGPPKPNILAGSSPDDPWDTADIGGQTGCQGTSPTAEHRLAWGRPARRSGSTRPGTSSGPVYCKARPRAGAHGRGALPRNALLSGHEFNPRPGAGERRRGRDFRPGRLHRDGRLPAKRLKGGRPNAEPGWFGQVAPRATRGPPPFPPARGPRGLRRVLSAFLGGWPHSLHRPTRDRFETRSVFRRHPRPVPEGSVDPTRTGHVSADGGAVRYIPQRGRRDRTPPVVSCTSPSNRRPRPPDGKGRPEGSGPLRGFFSGIEEPRPRSERPRPPIAPLAMDGEHRQRFPRRTLREPGKLGRGTRWNLLRPPNNGGPRPAGTERLSRAKRTRFRRRFQGRQTWEGGHPAGARWSSSGKGGPLPARAKVPSLIRLIQLDFPPRNRRPGGRGPGGRRRGAPEWEASNGARWNPDPLPERGEEKGAGGPRPQPRAPSSGRFGPRQIANPAMGELGSSSKGPPARGESARPGGPSQGPRPTTERGGAHPLQTLALPTSARKDRSR